MNKYGKKVREIREKNGDTLEDLAKKLNMTWSALGKYERGERKISPEVLEEISKVYDISLSYFFGNEKQKIPPELAEVGVEWIAFAKEMAENDLTPQQIKSLLDLISQLNIGKK